MHQRRQVRQVSTVQRFIFATLGAAIVAVTMVTAMNWNPVCAIYTPSDPEYWLFMCWYDPPPKDPSA